MTRLLLVACALYVGCAEGNSIPIDGSGGSGATGGDTGEGGDGASGAGTSDGGQPGVGGQGGSPIECIEDPCKLVPPQCGCPAGEKCAITNAQERGCLPDEGTAAIAAECGAGNDCAPGGICLGEASVGYCGEFCYTDAECATGTICSVLLNDGAGGTIPDVRLCSSSCDPGTASGCPTGLGCALGLEEDGAMRPFFLCFPAGNAIAGAPCTSAATCAPGLGCYNNGTADVCFQNCNVNNPSCGAQTCSPLTNMEGQQISVGNYTMGVCTP